MGAGSNETRSRLPALTGLGHVLLLFLGSAGIARTSGPGRHSLHASPEEVAAYLAEANLTRVWAGEYVALLAYLLFVPFAAYVWSTLRGTRVPDWLGGAMRGAAWIYVALSALGVGLLVPALRRELEPLDAAAFLDLRTTVLGLAFVFLAGWLVAVGAAAVGSRALPRWLGWSAVVIGLLQLAATPFAAYTAEVTGLPTFAGFLWIAIASVLLARRPRAAP